MKLDNFILKLVLIILLVGVVYAWTPQNDVDLINVYQILNGTNITALNFYGNGSGLTGVSSGDTNCSVNQSCPNIIYNSDESNLNVNRSGYWDNLNAPIDIETMGNFTACDINASCNIYVGTIQATDGNSISVQPTGDTDDFFSFKTPTHRPTIKREGGKYIYIDSSNVYDMGISFREDDTYSGTLNYDKVLHMLTFIGKASPIGFKPNSFYNNYILFETINSQPQISVWNGTILKINDSLKVIGMVNATAFYDDGVLLTPNTDTTYTAGSNISITSEVVSIATGFYTWLDNKYQPLESTLTDIADGTINENLVNTANPWADNEVSNTLTCSILTDDDTYATTSSAETFDENVAFAKNTSYGDNDYICMGDSGCADSSIHFNGTTLRIKVNS